MPADPLIESLIPHAGSMCLLERILDWTGDSIRCATSTHRSADNPLATSRDLRAVHLCEYGAQAMAVHGGLCARAAGGVAAPGMLVSLRDVTFDVANVAALDGELIVAAERLQASDEAWQYRFEIRHDDRVIARGRATVAIGRDDDRRSAPRPDPRA